MSPAADILSNLPNEIIHCILNAADLDIKSLARTSVLSKRWRHLWKSSLTKLHFLNIPLKVAEWGTFSQLVEKILSFRNDAEYCADLDALSLTTDGRLRPHMVQLLEKIFVHGVENRVRTFRFEFGSGCHIKSDPCCLTGLSSLSALLGSVENLELSFQGDMSKLLSPNESTDFSALRKLRLSRCSLVSSYETTAGVFEVNPETIYVPFKEIPNLYSLELVETEFMSLCPVKISGTQLEELVMVFPREPDFFILFDMMISAPRVKSFTCKEIRLSLIRRVELPSLECLDIDVFLYSGISSSYGKKKVSLEVLRFFRCFAGLKRVKLHPSTITALIMVPGFLAMQPSPFNRVECVEFHNCSTLISNGRVFNALVNYFFNDCIYGTALFDRIFTQPGASEDSSSRPVVVVYKSDFA